jgi:hypothetical protein
MVASHHKTSQTRTESWWTARRGGDEIAGRCALSKGGGPNDARGAPRRVASAMEKAEMLYKKSSMARELSTTLDPMRHGDPVGTQRPAGRPP